MFEEGDNSKGFPGYQATFLFYKTYHNYDSVIAWLMFSYSF